MSAEKYTDVDARLLRNIAAGVNTLTRLECDSVLMTLCAPFANAHNPEFRVIDRRLQANRKAGKIRYNGRAWVIQQEQPQ